MRGNCSFASQVATVHARKASNTEGIARCILPAEERGEAKMHSLSPRRQTASARTSSAWRWRGASVEEEHRREASTVEERQREASAAEERTLSRQPPAPSSPSLRAAGDPLCRTAMASAPPEVGPGESAETHLPLSIGPRLPAHRIDLRGRARAASSLLPAGTRTSRERRKMPPKIRRRATAGRRPPCVAARHTVFLDLSAAHHLLCSWCGIRPPQAPGMPRRGGKCVPRRG
jgi:hypothetical protein